MVKHISGINIIKNRLTRNNKLHVDRVTKQQNHTVKTMFHSYFEVKQIL